MHLRIFLAYLDTRLMGFRRNGVNSFNPTLKLCHTKYCLSLVHCAYLLSQLVNYIDINPLEFRGNYSATSNNTKLVHWLLMGGLLHLVQQGGDWVGPQPAQAPPRCTKCNRPPINGQCTNHRIALQF